MSYLLEFVKTFDDKEMMAFRHLDLKGREEQMRDAYLHISDKKFDESKLPARFDLTQAHFDKITSILLDKIIDHLYQGDYNEALSTILRKGLSQLMLHELKIMERMVLKNKNKEEQVIFYRAAFNNLRSMFHPGYNSKLTHQYGKKYLDSLGRKKTLADESYVEMLSMYGDTLSNARSANPNAFLPVGRKRLELWDKKTEKADDPVARCYYAFAKLTFLKTMTDDFEGYKKSVELFAQSYFAAPAGAVDTKFRGTVYFESGFACMEGNDYEGAFSNYSKVRSEFKDTLGNNVYHTGHYIMSCLLTGHYDEAVKAAEEVYVPRIKLNINRSMLFDIYTTSCLIYLHSGDYKMAEHYVKELQTYRSNEITRFGQAILRTMETLYALISSDYKNAVLLVKRNLKFLKADNATASVSTYHMQLMVVLQKVVKAKEKKLDAKGELHQAAAGLQKGVYAVYNSLLTKVIDRDF